MRIYANFSMYRIISEVPLYIVILIFIIMVDHVLVFGQSPRSLFDSKSPISRRIMAYEMK